MRLLSFALLAGVAGCSEPTGPSVSVDTTVAYWPTTAWRIAAPEAVGVDGPAFRGIVDQLNHGAVPGVHSFVAVRYGYVFAESYFQGGSASQPHTLQSVSKSVTSLLVGIARDSGLLASIDAPVLGFFPEYTDLAAVDDAKRALRVRDLLSMRTGMSFWEEPYNGSPLQQLNTCACDWLHFVLDRPMSGAPDQSWAYNSGGVIVLGGVIHAVAGVPADEFARQVLFAPLGISQWSWIKGQPNGLPHMGGGLYLRSSDLARIGYLILKRGDWKGKRLVSENWIEASTARVTTTTPSYFPRATDYGFLWWLFPRNGLTGPPSGDDYIVAASGSGGQWMFIDRAKNLVVVFTAELGSGSWPAVQLFFDQLEPAVR